MSIAADFIDRNAYNRLLSINAYSRLLSIIARKLGHDCLVLTCELQFKENHCSAIFRNYEKYDIALLEANDRPVQIKCVDAEERLRSNDDMHHELIELVYKILDTGGTVSDGKNEVDASAVSEFMIECALNGYV